MTQALCDDWHREAVALQAAGQLTEAMRLYQRCLEAQPDYTPALYNAGLAMLQHGHYPDAIKLLLRAYQTCPNDYNIILGYGIALRQSGRLDEAKQVFCHADRLAPDQPQAMCNLAAMHNSEGEALLGDCFLAEATRRQPDFPNVCWLNAMRLLRQKRYREAWPLFESRFTLSGQNANISVKNLPVWRGESVPFAVVREQGHGDCLMMARFLRTASVAEGLRYIEVTSPLTRLFQHNFPHIPVGADARLADNIQAVLPFMGLPAFLEVDYLDVVDNPYLETPPEAVSAWQPRIPARQGRLRIAIFWRGSPKHVNDAQRSIPFSSVKDLLLFPGVTWISIQHEASREEEDWMAAQEVLHLGAQIEDFTALSGVLSQVDLLIGVDSAPVHLAGALGVPTWLLLAKSPDWRWGETGRRTRWYRRLQLIRQIEFRDWTAPLAGVKRGLRRLLRRDHG